MATMELTQDTLETTIAQGIVLIDFWAAWCGPCRMFAPIYEAASEKHDDIVFGKVDTEKERAIAAAFGIRSIPTLVAFRDGVIVFSQPGALPGSALEKIIRAVRDLDMDEVRRKIAEAAKGEGGAS